MRVCFVPAYMDGLPLTSASVRFRAEWVAKYWTKADVYPDCSIRFVDYDAYVFQKTYLTDWSRRVIRLLRAQGKLLAFDLCDADWKQGETHLRRLLTVLPLFDFAVCPTLALKEWLDTYVPAHVIPDRLDMAEFPESMRRRWKPGESARVIWFGYAHNLGELDHIWPEIKPVLDQYDVPLWILSNELPDSWKGRMWGRGREPLWIQWTRAGANAAISYHDIALVPQRSPYKSDNRSSTAWALGVVPVSTAAELRGMLDDEARLRYVEKQYARVRAAIDVRHSVAAWRGLFDHYVAKRHALNSAATMEDAE